jgi:hypothetical protein
MGDHPQKPAEYQIGHGEWLVTLQNVVKPIEVCLVVGGILAMDVDQHVNVDQQHPVGP